MPILTMFQEGDVVEIPLPDGRTAVGWILHISQRAKNAVGFIVFGIKGQLRNANFDVNRRLDVLGPMYTGIEAIQHYGWETIAHQPLSDDIWMITKRHAGGGVYVADEYIGSVEELGEHQLPPMLVYGMLAVYKQIEKAFP